MLLLCLCTLTGAYSLALFPGLPADSCFLGCVLAGAGCLGRRILRPFAFFLLGFAMMGCSASAQLADRLDPGLANEQLSITARIEGFPAAEGASVRFVVRPVGRNDLPERIRLTWHAPEVEPRIGESWRLQVRLKRPRGYANPGGFDYEGWLFRERIGATGYVSGDARSYRIHGETSGLVSRVREAFAERVEARLPRDDAAAVLMAIGVGARHKISRDQWDLYARTGTSHLMAISGLHVGLAAGCAYLLSWGLAGLMLKRANIRDIAVSTAMLAAAFYAALSGFAVPSRRALIMTCVAGALLLLRRRLRTGALLAIPCFAIFVTDPLAILTPGFKLSFAAVAILISIARLHVQPTHWPRWPRTGAALTGLRRLGILQIALLAGLFPLTVLIFGRFALVAPLVNLLVLPVFNFVTVPLTLAGALLVGPFEVVGNGFLNWAHGSIEVILQLVTVAGNLPYASYETRQLNTAMACVSLVSLLYVALPDGWPGRKLAIVAIVAVLTYRPPSPPLSCLEYHVLDVGQGLAVVLRTHGHALLFDTGPAFRNGGSTAERVVLPFLQAMGIDRLDRLIVSHGDQDHAGGIHSISRAIQVDRILVGETLPAWSAPQTRCVAGIGWQVDGVGFSILHPRRGAPWKRNNSSCVLEVTVGHRRLLLAGDIESPVEKLLAYRAAFRASDVVLVPHHGSRTSSSAALVDATGPVLAIVSAGFGNHWGFPKADVVARWEAAGAEILNTATAGAISQRFCPEAIPGPVRRERVDSRRYWHDVPSGPAG